MSIGKIGPPTPPPKRTSSSLSSSGSSVPKPDVLLAELEVKFYTGEEAKEFTPKVKGCYVSNKVGTAWEIKYLSKPTSPYSHTVGYDPECVASHYNALLEVLRWAWAEHCELEAGAVCPYNLGVPLG